MNDERKRLSGSSFIVLCSSLACRWCARVEVELNLGRLAAPRRPLEVRLLAEVAHAGDDAGGELQDVRVVRLRRFVEASALDGDAVLRSFELRLQLEEVLVRLQFGITLHHDE